VTIAPELLASFPSLNDDQKAVISHFDGPLLVIAGPGSGKTLTLVLRTLNLLMRGLAEPGQIVVCTFTEKAAFELRDRIASAARQTRYAGDLSELRTGTIHGICNRILMEYRHQTPLGAGFETLDDLTQLLFIFENFDVIAPGASPYMGRWSTKWRAVEGLRSHFNKITEELIDPERLAGDSESFVSAIGECYLRYRNTLFGANRVDFAHQQRLVYDLLADEAVRESLVSSIHYVMVDEFQDTNHVQVEVVRLLASGTGNLAAIGDEDQSLYRFRGATVRNLLEFPQRFPEAQRIILGTNYRSHKTIVGAYDRWMASADWSNPNGPAFRFDKTIQPDPTTDYPDYPAVFSIRGRGERDEAARVADLVGFLKDAQVISDYSQVAILLYSVRSEHSGPYIAGLAARGIPTFCPRARTWFENEEVRLMIGAFALVFGYHGGGRGDMQGRALANLAAYCDECIVELGKRCAPPHPMALLLQGLTAEIAGLHDGEALDMRPADYFYRFMAQAPFHDFVKDENRARNLATLSQLLNVFQIYYHYSVVTHANREILRYHFFTSFLRLLFDGGINEYEDPNQPTPKGYVQIMTIHQAKGLEFPVTIVGSLDSQISTAKQIDRDLGRYYQRPPHEPESRITTFDRMRLHYVAFSRAEKILVLTAADAPKPHFATIVQGLPQWPYVAKDLLAAQRFAIKERTPLKRRFSFTGDLKVYETCPRQYQFFREYDFTPSRSAVIFFGLLVHQTIEEIHRVAIAGKSASLDESGVAALFERTFALLARSDVRPIGPAAQASALEQVLNYFRQNQAEMRRVIATEVDVSVEKEDYILSGKVDLLLGGDGRLELLDFKTAPKPEDRDALIQAYERQLCIYAHILERRHGKRPDRLLVYFTSEPLKADALVELPYRPGLVEAAGRHFDEVVAKVLDKDFRVITPPERKICKECDMKSFCVVGGLIRDPDPGPLGASR
jgi:DNA helicase-2/ATP-dependent DNA helicase PcrA